MNRAYIIVDNLKIGGYQRLSLDQAYALSDLDFTVSIIVLSPKGQWDSAKIEAADLSQKTIELVESGSNRYSIFKTLFKIIPQSEKDALIISHSLRATFALRFMKILLGRKFTINTTLHQLPRLSHFTQRLKRFIYSQFSDNLFCFSRAAEVDWYNQFGDKFEFLTTNFSKKMHLMRNGVYLGRLSHDTKSPKTNTSPRIIYLGRLSFWKGLDTIKMMAKSRELDEFDFVLMVPAIKPEDLAELAGLLGARLTVIEGKSVASFSSQRGDVHIYPANYGNEVKVIESISLNCLEMCAMGVPSVVTAGGLATWPELSHCGLVQEVDWSDIKEIERVIRLSQLVELSVSEQTRITQLVDINRQIERYLKSI
jgi:glycosyltransferase involved in cell wall biosynthesis